MQAKYKILIGVGILALAGTGIYLYRRNKNKAKTEKLSSEKAVLGGLNSAKGKLIAEILKFQSAARITGKVYTGEELNKLTEPELEKIKNG